MTTIAKISQLSILRENIANAYHQDETKAVTDLLHSINLDDKQKRNISEQAYQLVQSVRNHRQSDIDAFLQEFELTSKEGVVLMCLAEALLRVPDAITIDKLIADKLTNADWQKHLGHSQSLFVNASTWALMLTGKVIKIDDSEYQSSSLFKSMVARMGSPVIRQAVTQSMRILGKQFVLGRNIIEALERAREFEKQGFAYSYDMLGEAARTDEDAICYFNSYRQAINSIKEFNTYTDLYQSPGISIKLSALHPRYEYSQSEVVFAVLVPRLLQLAMDAKEANISLTIDAEEADRLDLSLDIIEYLAHHKELKGWQGLGLALQAYQKRAFFVIDWLADLAKKSQRRIMLRLVKGAYWDSEIKWSQQEGYEDYPVFTRKSSTDVSYIACAQKILQHTDLFYPQFATHNAHTLATILTLCEGKTSLEFQRLHGMGESLYQQMVTQNKYICRIYAPVGSHEDLLAYLVRRLLENGANTSFVNRIQDASLAIEKIISDPIEKTKKLIEDQQTQIPHPQIPTPPNIYGARKNAATIDLSDPLKLLYLNEELQSFLPKKWQAGPIVDGELIINEKRVVHSPQDHDYVVGHVMDANEQHIEQALKSAQEQFFNWNAVSVSERAEKVSAIGDLLEKHFVELIALCVLEAGKTLPDAIAEVREAVDFCRYYAEQARLLENPYVLPGPTGEYNALSFTGRGVFLCISPWNFPLAIFIGQITAALVMGNTVIAKPAEQTPLIAARAIQLMLEAGIPKESIHLLPGRGETVGAQLVKASCIQGVVFTGSTETARLINQSLATKQGPIVPLIAETGGQNVLVSDSTTLPEQLISDVITSAFQSAGQRCSALRVLFVQEEVADKILQMLKGAIATLSVDNPLQLATDIGPVIDKDAQTTLLEHIAALREKAKFIAEAPLANSMAKKGYFVAPIAFEINSLKQLPREVFGPVLHVIRYSTKNLPTVLEQIRDTGYGLTMGIHSRIDSTIANIVSQCQVGNIYVNRNMIGATVGVQPFGGQGLSGTGPKAGGPHYLHRFASERTLTIDTTSAGGNASLLSLQDEA